MRAKETAATNVGRSDSMSVKISIAEEVAKEWTPLDEGSKGCNNIEQRTGSKDLAATKRLRQESGQGRAF